MEITLKELELRRACNLDQFKKLFGDKVTITEKNCLLAVKGGLSLDWAAANFFTAPALEAYEKATAPALEAYEKATAPAWEAYEKAAAPAWKAYKKATAPALEAYKKAKATAFFKASLKMKKGNRKMSKCKHEKTYSWIARENF